MGWRGGRGRARKGRGNERKLNLEFSLEFNINYSPWQFAVRSLCLGYANVVGHLPEIAY